MIIPIHISVRGVLVASLIIASISFLIIINNSKEKREYESINGKIEYIGKEYQHLPTRHKGDFRYLLVEGYPYPFEIYKPNSKPTLNSIDDLKLDDIIDIYFYEIDNTHKVGINKFTQFIDKNQTPYFIRNSFQKRLGYMIVGMCLLMNIGSLIFWKNKKLKW
jgi:hypothetical protein